MAYTAMSRGLPPLGPVPGLLPWWAVLAGRTDRRAARAFAARLEPAFDGWRSLGGERVRVELALTLPPRLARRLDRRSQRFTRWTSAAIRWAAGNAPSWSGLSRGAVGIRVDFVPGAPRWGEAILSVDLGPERE